jgi:hypothetical protein
LIRFPDEGISHGSRFHHHQHSASALPLVVLLLANRERSPPTVALGAVNGSHSLILPTVREWINLWSYDHICWFGVSAAAPYCDPGGATRHTGRRAPAIADREHLSDEGSGICEGLAAFVVRSGCDHFGRCDHACSCAPRFITSPWVIVQVLPARSDQEKARRGRAQSVSCAEVTGCDNLFQSRLEFAISSRPWGHALHKGLLPGSYCRVGDLNYSFLFEVICA